MTETKKYISVAYRISDHHADRMEALSRIAGISKTKMFEALIDAAYQMSTSEIERLIHEGEYQVHFNASCKLAQKLKLPKWIQT